MTINKGKPILKACLYMFIHIILHILSKDICCCLVLLKGWLLLHFCRHSLRCNDISFPMGLHILLYASTSDFNVYLVLPSAAYISTTGSVYQPTLDTPLLPTAMYILFFRLPRAKFPNV